MPEQKIDKVLLRKYLHGSCTPEEQALVAAFLTKPESSRLLDEILEEQAEQDWKVFTQTDSSHRELSSWQQKAHHLLDFRKQKTPFRSQPSMFYRIAASIVLVLCAAYSIHLLFKPNKATAVTQFETSTPKGKMHIISLPDGSKIYLGPESQLHYAKVFDRQVYLDGEAFFEIAQDAKTPFIVYTDQIQTKVLGTSFKINGFKTEPFSVAVATGKIEVNHHREGKIQLLGIVEKGDKLTYASGISKLEKTNEADIEGWKQGKLIYNAAPIRDILTALSRWHNVTIDIQKQALANEKLTVTLTASLTTSQVMELLASAGGFHYKITGNRIIVY